MSSNPKTTAVQPDAPERWRSLVVPALFAALALGMLFSLGAWQLSRLAWKQGLIAQVDERARAPAIPLAGRDAWGRMSPERDDYRRVTVTGRFRHEAEAYLYHVAGDSRQADRDRPRGQGYFVMTPLVMANGDTIIVNRGFVPTERRDPATRPEGQLQGEVSVTGLVRYPEPRGAFSAVDDRRAACSTHATSSPSRGPWGSTHGQPRPSRSMPTTPPCRAGCLAAARHG